MIAKALSAAGNEAEGGKGLLKMNAHRSGCEVAPEFRCVEPERRQSMKRCHLGHRPADSSLLLKSIEVHQQQFGHAPDLVAADAAFNAGPKTDAAANKMGVKRLAIPSDHYLNAHPVRPLNQVATPPRDARTLDIAQFLAQCHR